MASYELMGETMVIPTYNEPKMLFIPGGVKATPTRERQNNVLRDIDAYKRTYRVGPALNQWLLSLSRNLTSYDTTQLIRNLIW